MHLIVNLVSLYKKRETEQELQNPFCGAKILKFWNNNLSPVVIALQEVFPDKSQEETAGL